MVMMLYYILIGLVVMFIYLWRGYNRFGCITLGYFLSSLCCIPFWPLHVAIFLVLWIHKNQEKVILGKKPSNFTIGEKTIEPEWLRKF